MKASFKGRVQAIQRDETQETTGGRGVHVILDVRGPVIRGGVQQEMRAHLTTSAEIADRLVFGAVVTIEVEIADREVG